MKTRNRTINIMYLIGFIIFALFLAIIGNQFGKAAWCNSIFSSFGVFLMMFARSKKDE